MKCRCCNKETYAPGEPYCLGCEELIFEARCEAKDQERERREQEGENVD